ncbi:MAG: S41 family peptidase [Dysgonomonas sp.]
MKKTLLLCVCIITCFSVRSNSLPVLKNDSIPRENTLQDKLFGLSKIWSEIKYNFVNIDQVKFDLDSLYNATIPKVIATDNDVEYYDELQRFMASFNDGHTQLLQRNYSWNDINDYVPIGLTDINNKIYISQIRKNAGIDSTLVGGEIIDIEGLPVVKYMEERIYPYISASTDGHRWFQAVGKMQGDRKGTYLRGKVKKTDGTIVPFSILRNGETTRTPNDKSWQWASSKISPKRQRISLDWRGGIAILDVRTFALDIIKKDIDSLAVLINNKAKGLVVDLRYNGGGSTDVAEHLQKYLTHNGSFLTFGSQVRINDSYGRSQGNYRDEYKDFFLGKAYKTEGADTVIVDKGIVPFRCPVIILIGRYTFSAAEDFLIDIYEVPDRPLIMGEPTGGSTGAPLMVPLPHGAMARVCTVRMLYPYSGKPFVGKGIQPDIELKQSVSDYLEGRDIVLESAIDKLK